MSSPVEQHAKTPLQRLYLWWRLSWSLFVVLGMMFGCAFVVTTLHCLTLGRARRFNMNVVAKWFSSGILYALGVHVDCDEKAFLDAPAVYITNHTSTLDFFVITSLGLPNVRAFMSVKNRVILPIWLMGKVLGHFFIPTQDDPAGRTACFKRATRVLLRSQDSVFLTPEGTRHVDGQIGHFNKGSFHLAQVLKWPIVPLFIKVPDEINPGKGFKTRPGRVCVHVAEPIDVEGWDDVEGLRDEMRQYYVDWRTKIYAS